MKKIIFIGFILFYNYALKAQDIQFTQFQSSPLYLNPSFTGANADSRIASSYRNQWWNIPGTYKTFILSYDHYIHDIHSGVGGFIVSDNAGSMSYGNRYLGLTYSYDYKFDRYWSLSSGIKISYGYRSLDFSKLIFGDQLQRGASSSLQPILPERSSYFDFSWGTLLFSNDHFVGVTIDHLNRPDQSFRNLEGRLPVKYSFHAAKTFYTDKSGGSGKKTDKPVILALVQYRFQKAFDQTDIGIIYKKPDFFAGIYYRGIPWLKYYKKGYPNNDAFCVLGGIRFKTLELAYSYDFTISWQTYKTGGSHELSLIYQFYNPKKPKKHRSKIIPCAKF